jgi:hypothetical protein
LRGHCASCRARGLYFVAANAVPGGGAAFVKAGAVE